jgi:ADP-heptose:LPS heptosyltransferase
MWWQLLKRRARAHAGASRAATPGAIEAAQHILFAVFGRYGDSIIAFKIINEFIRCHPAKRYTVITTPQARPYAEALISGDCQYHGVNKRHDPLKLWRLVRTLKRQAPDLAFNPWSHGEESEFFISYARQFHYYRHAGEPPRDVNLYARVRDYLLLPVPAAVPRARLAATTRHVVLSPFSTDVRKSLDAADVGALLAALRRRFAPQRLTIAGFAPELSGLATDGVEHFVFRKSAGCSSDFLALLSRADLFVGVDAGPLHLADALGVAAVGLFGPTPPETILDRDSGIVPLRHAALEGVFCDVGGCRDPLCVHALCAQLSFDAPVPVLFGRRLVIESRDSPYVARTRAGGG